MFHFLLLEGKIQDRSLCLFRITLGGNVVDQRNGNGVDTFDDLMSSRSVQGHHFSTFEMLDMMTSLALNKTKQNSYKQGNFLKAKARWVI